MTLAEGSWEKKGATMPDIDAELVRTWLEMEGFFVRSSVTYQMKKGDLDLLAVHPRDPVKGLPQKFWGEVKMWVDSKEPMPRSWRIVETVKDSFFSTPKKVLFVQEVLGKDFRRVVFLPVQRMSSREQQAIRKMGIKIWDLGGVAQDLHKASTTRGNLWRESEESLRLVKLLQFYGLAR